MVYVDWEKKEGTYKARLLMGKCRLTSLKGNTIPKAEPQALIVLCRLIMVAAGSLDWPVEQERISTYSEAVIAAVSQRGLYAGQDKVYWTNRPSEVKGILQELKSQASNVEEVTHVSSKLNPADIGTLVNIDIDAGG